MASDREMTIRRWMLATVSDGGIERLDDLHVDDIDAGWKDPTSWVSAGLTAYGLALGIRRELGLDVAVALAFSLVDAQDTSEDVFDTQAEFENQLDWSPPSLYLFKIGDQQHLSDTVRVDPLPKALFSLLPEDTESFLLRWLAEDGSQRRSVFVQAWHLLPPTHPKRMHERYGQPISETYLIRPGIAVAARYGPSQQVCSITVYPEHPKHPLNSRENSIGDYKQVVEVLSELMPEKERGKYLMGTLLDLFCSGQDDDCGGVEEDWEKLTINRMGNNDAEHYAAIHWKRAECKEAYNDVH